MIVHLTEEFIRTSLCCPPDRRKIEFADKSLPGLLIEVSSRSPGVGSYRLRYRDSVGRTRYASLGRTDVVSLEDARSAAKKLKAELQLGHDPRQEAQARKSGTTLDEFWRVYFEHAKARKKTWGKDEQLWRIHVQPKFGDRKMDSITKGEVLAFQTQLKAQGLSASQANHCVRLMRQMYNLALDHGIVSSNPARIKLLAERKLDYYLKGDDLTRLISVLTTDENRPVCHVVLFLLATGARLSEALNARWSHIDRKARLWTLPAEGNKSGRTRSIPLGRKALAVLDEVGTEGKHDRIFVSAKTGKPLRHVHKVWDRLRREAGLPELRLHSLRHSFASYLVSKGHSLFRVQAILGHRSPLVTQRYAHLAADTLHQVADAASDVIEEATERVV